MLSEQNKKLTLEALRTGMILCGSFYTPAPIKSLKFVFFWCILAYLRLDSYITLTCVEQFIQSVLNTKEAQINNVEADEEGFVADEAKVS